MKLIAFKLEFGNQQLFWLKKKSLKTTQQHLSNYDLAEIYL